MPLSRTCVYVFSLWRNKYDDDDDDNDDVHSPYYTVTMYLSLTVFETLNVD